jgi:hypothetical protein
MRSLRRWKAGPPEERDLWQGLAQICVAITDAARGNLTGAERLSDRAAMGVGSVCRDWTRHLRR